MILIKTDQMVIFAVPIPFEIEAQVGPVGDVVVRGNRYDNVLGSVQLDHGCSIRVMIELVGAIARVEISPVLACRRPVGCDVRGSVGSSSAGKPKLRLPGAPRLAALTSSRSKLTVTR